MTSKYKLSLLILMFLICFNMSCDIKRYKAYQDMKDFVLNENNAGGVFLMFFKTTSDNIAYESASNLQRDLHYSNHFQEIRNIKSFYKDIMKGKIILTCDDLINCFNPISNIINECQTLGVNELLKKYTEYDKYNNVYIICNDLTYDEKLSVAYCLYLNNIYTRIDDYSGKFISTKSVTSIFTNENADDLEEF